MEDDLWWKTTFDGRRPWMKEDHWWKTTFEGRWPQREDDFYGRRPKTTFDGGPPLMEDSLWWKMTFDGWWPSICKMTFMDDDLWWRVPSKWWSCSIFLRSPSFLRLSYCLTSYSSLEDDLYGRRPLTEDRLWWFTLLLWMCVVSGYFKIVVLVHLSRWSYSSIFCCRNAWGKEMAAASKRSMLGEFWIQHWNPGEILTNFHVNSYFVAWKLTELDRKTRYGVVLCERVTPTLLSYGDVEAHSVKGLFYAHWKDI